MTPINALRATALLMSLVAVANAQISPGGSTRTFQWGVSGGTSAITGFCAIAPTGGDGSVTEGASLPIGSARALLVMPRIIGPLASQVPPGAQVTSATLAVHVDSVPGASANRTLTLSPLFDLTGVGPWHEPAAAVASGTGVGVSWMSRDSRPGIAAPWLLPGGDVATVPAPWSDSQTIDQTPDQWCVFDVTAVVGLMTDGWTNAGWALDCDQSGTDVILSGDDHPTAGRRPVLTVQWSTVAAPMNHTPAAPDLTVSTTDGAPVTVQLPFADQDGESLTYVIRERPQHGTLEGQVWWVYKPQPGFVGTDRWTYYVHDGFATSPMGTVTVNVTADAAAANTTWSNLGPAPGMRAATVDVTEAPGGQVATTGPEITLAHDTQAAVMDIPDLLTGATSVPAGATIVAAQLDLTVSSNSAATSVTVSAHRLTDPARLGPWHLPASPGSAPDSGVSWMYRDARPGHLTPWLVPGGERAGGSSAEPLPGPQPGEVVSFDVTAAVNAWIGGAPNLGWVLESNSPDVVGFASPSHGDPSWRPRLTVTWRAPGSVGSDLPPIADAGGDVQATPNELIQMDGGGSYDPEGQPLQQLWFQTGGPAYPIPAPTSLAWTFHAPTTPGTYTFVLGVSDGVGYDFDTRRVTVVAPTGPVNAPPVADPGPGVIRPEGALYFLNATSSFDPEGTPLTGWWEQVSGPPALEFEPTANPLMTRVRLPFTPAAQSPMPLGFRVTVSDGVHTSVGWTVIFIVDGPNNSPTAAAGPNQSAESHSWVGLDGRASSDPDPQHLYFTWTQTTGPAVTLHGSDRVPHFRAPTVTAPVNLVFELEVSDGEYADTATTTVTVLPSPPEFTGNPQSLTPYTDTITIREARHLLRRAGFSGPTDAVNQVRANGLTGAVTQLLNPIAEPAVDAEAWGHVPIPVTGDTYPQANLEQVAEWWTTYMLRSQWRNQLREKMAYFFHDLYATGGAIAGTGERHWRMQHIDLFRDRPFPNYRQFLIDLTQDDLMLDWLDNHRNESSAPNENYAREFWELFTLGPTDPFTGLPNYTETDIQEASRAFTGWERYDPPENPSDSYYSRFNQARHDNGMKDIFGFIGPWKDEDIVDITMTRPQAAEFIALNLFRFFVHDHPDHGVVQALAQVLTSNGWELKPVVETILKSEAMFSADAATPRVKQPLSYLIGFMRESGLETSVDTLHDYMLNLGHVLGDPPNVKGWPEGGFWLGEASMAYRAQAIAAVTEDRLFQQGVSLDHLLPQPGLRSGAATVAHLLRLLDIELDDPDQFHALTEYMNTVDNGQGRFLNLFNGDIPVHVDRKLRGVLFLLAFATTDYHTH